MFENKILDTWFFVFISSSYWTCLQRASTFNLSLPNLATAVLACWPEFEERQLQEIDCSNPKTYDLSCIAHNVFKFRKHVKNWMEISTMLILSLLGGYFSIDHVSLFEHLFQTHMDVRHHVLSHFLTFTQFIC